MCFLSTVWEQRRLRTGCCDHSVHHTAVYPIQMAGATNAYFSTKPKPASRTSQAGRENLLIPLLTKGTRILNRHWKPQGGAGWSWHPPLNDSACLSSAPLPALYIYLYANTLCAAWKAPPVPSEDCSRRKLQEDSSATGACGSWICSSDIWNSSADFTAPFFTDTHSLPITRVFQ